MPRRSVVDKKASVAVTVQVEGDRISLKEAGDIYTNGLEISMMAMDLLGKVPDGDRANLDLKLRKQTRDLMTQTGIRSVGTLDLPPGSYELHVAARESNNGTLGSVFTDLEVPDFSEPFERRRHPALIVGRRPHADAAHGRGTRGAPARATPTTRGFATVESIFGYVDVYDSLQPLHGVTSRPPPRGSTAPRCSARPRNASRRSSVAGRAAGTVRQFEIPLKDFTPGLLRAQGGGQADDSTSRPSPAS